MKRGNMQFLRSLSLILSAGAMCVGGSAFAQQLAMAHQLVDCAPDEPVSVQISWTAPCDSGTWLMDTEAGCRMWDWHPNPDDKVVWSGACKGGLKDGQGVVQWFEDGLPIDRFEGTYREGKREGIGRYTWNDRNRFEGQFANDLPNGYGTVRLEGETFAGEWRNGCLSERGKVVAIGVPRASCGGRSDPVAPGFRQSMVY
jgi:hypothetical protein